MFRIILKNQDGAIIGRFDRTYALESEAYFAARDLAWYFCSVPYHFRIERV